MSEVRSEGPFVSLAVLCERAYRQPDGSTDLVRIIDSVCLDSPFLDEIRETSLRLLAVIGLSSGQLRGGHVIAVRGKYPGGVDGPMVARLVEFTDDNPKVMLLMPMLIELERIGTYWFEVTFDQRLMTRIPLAARRSHWAYAPAVGE